MLVSPFLVNAMPTYLAANFIVYSFRVSSDITSAILTTRILPLELVFPLFHNIGFLLFSKAYKGRLVSLPTLLLSIWLFVPLILTQGYLSGFIIDYNRFLYFIILPIIIFIALLIDHASSFFAKELTFTAFGQANFQNLRKPLTRKY